MNQFLPIVFYILIFLLGASVGSFLSVVIYRIQNNKPGIIAGHSYCPHCKNQLRFIDLFPVLSYLFLGGKCRRCHKPIPVRYFFLELITGLAFTAILFYFPFFQPGINDQSVYQANMILPFLLHALYSSFLIGIFFYDLETKQIPDLFLFPFIVVTALGSLLLGAPSFTSMLLAALIAIIFFGGQILISKGAWLGEGDLYLAISMAFMLGWEKFLVSIIVGYFLGAFISVMLLATKKATRQTAIPFAPFLVIGTFASLFFGEMLIAWYMTGLFY